mmetsp:Transcript_33780/g.39117  ORF Transcript_33780/g.39117 Transcript_33780/m.39117 type:complete len:192 (+) Transcript_33780:80-655(+)
MPSTASYESLNCNIFMAESSIPKSGLGLYSTQNITRGSNVGYPELNIVTTDMFWQHNLDFTNWVYSDYDWEPSHMGLGCYEARETKSHVPGMGAALNCHMGLNNVYHLLSTRDDADLLTNLWGDNGESVPWEVEAEIVPPTLGSMSLYGGILHYADKDILAGDELFTTYGEHYFDSREDMNKASSFLKNEK